MIILESIVVFRGKTDTENLLGLQAKLTKTVVLRPVSLGRASVGLFAVLPIQFFPDIVLLSQKNHDSSSKQ